MDKTNRLLYYCVLLVFTFFACKKNEFTQILSEETNKVYSQVVSYLNAEQVTANTRNAKKIDRLLKNLSASNSFHIKLESRLDLFIYDLVDYRNKSYPEFKNTYYKVYFQLTNDKVVGGMVYTIHTDLSKSQVDADFENIFLQQSRNFSGRIVVNRLNDEFAQELVFKNGRLEKSYRLGIKEGQNENYSKESNESSSSGSSVENYSSVENEPTCTSYYWVETIYYTDGSKTEEWEYMYTECFGQGCGAPEGQVISWIDNGSCDGTVGGDPDVYSTEYEGFEEEVFVNEQTVSCGAKMHYDITRFKKNGVTYSIYAAPAICKNPIIDCVLGTKNCKRTVQVGNHSPIVTPLPNFTWRVTYVYTNFYTFKFNDGSPTSTSYRNMNISRIVS